MTIKIHKDITQGSDEWHALRCGILTASEVKRIITPAKLEFSKDDKCKTHAYELAAQRTFEYTEPSYYGDDMLRGDEDEIDARELYDTEIAPVEEVGFITNDKWGFTLGCSPDGMVGDNGMIEIKSRCQKLQFETIANKSVPVEFMLQIQTQLLVSERDWCDFISYSAGMHMYVQRVEADKMMQFTILAAAAQFEAQVQTAMERYTKHSAKLIPTERREELQILIGG